MVYIIADYYPQVMVILTVNSYFKKLETSKSNDFKDINLAPAFNCLHKFAIPSLRSYGKHTELLYTISASSCQSFFKRSPYYISAGAISSCSPSSKVFAKSLIS